MTKYFQVLDKNLIKQVFDSQADWTRVHKECRKHLKSLGYKVHAILEDRYRSGARIVGFTVKSGCKPDDSKLFLKKELASGEYIPKVGTALSKYFKSLNVCDVNDIVAKAVGFRPFFYCEDGRLILTNLSVGIYGEKVLFGVSDKDETVKPKPRFVKRTSDVEFEKIKKESKR